MKRKKRNLSNDSNAPKLKNYRGIELYRETIELGYRHTKLVIHYDRGKPEVIEKIGDVVI